MFGDKSYCVLYLRIIPLLEVVLSNRNYTSYVEWLSQNDALAILSDYKKRNPNLVKLYESLFKMSWDDFHRLPTCMLPETK